MENETNGEEEEKWGKRNKGRGRQTYTERRLRRGDKHITRKDIWVDIGVCVKYGKPNVKKHEYIIHL